MRQEAQLSDPEMQNWLSTLELSGDYQTGPVMWAVGHTLRYSCLGLKQALKQDTALSENSQYMVYHVISTSPLEILSYVSELG